MPVMEHGTLCDRFEPVEFVEQSVHLGSVGPVEHSAAASCKRASALGLGHKRAGGRDQSCMSGRRSAAGSYSDCLFPCPGSRRG